jgi:GT2 family glycosyltransferase
MGLAITVVIPTHNRAREIGACLARMAPGKQSLGEVHYEVIVSDDGDDDATRDLIARDYPWVRWTRSAGKGPAPNRNHGAKEATGDWLVFIDDDCLAVPGMLAEIHRLAQSGDVDVVEGRIACPGGIDHPLYVAPDNAGGGVFWTANLSLRRDRFERLGGFDHDLAFNAEDMELGERIKRQGLRVVFSDAARVDHPCQRLTLRQYWKRFWTYKALYQFALKTGRAPGLETGRLRVAWYVVSSHLLRQARILRQLLDFRRQSWRRMATMAALHWSVMPIMLPHLLIEEFRFRRLLNTRSERGA